MRCKVLLSGEFININNVYIEKRLPVEIKCGGCMETHENIVTLSAYVEEHNKYHERGNLVVHCKNCKEEMKLSIYPVGEEDERYYYGLRSNNGFIIAEVGASGCIIKSVPLYEFFVKGGNEDMQVIIKEGEYSEMGKDGTMIAVSGYNVSFTD